MKLLVTNAGREALVRACTLRLFLQGQPIPEWAGGAALDEFEPGDTAALRRAIMALLPDAPFTTDRLDDLTLLISAHFHLVVRAEPYRMPPDAAHVERLVDTVAFRHRLTNRAQAWSLIGVKPDSGRNLLTRAPHRVTWPIYFTLVSAGLG